MADEFKRPSLNVTFDKEVLADLKELAKRKGFTASGYVRYIIQREIKNDRRNSS